MLPQQWVKTHMSEYAIRDATVLAVDSCGALVTVDPETEADCGGCSSCAMKSLCRGQDAGRLDVRIPVADGGQLRPGERIRVAYRGANPAVAALILFLPGLLGVVFGGFAANALAGGGDGVFLTGALTGLAVGTGITYAVSRSVASLRPDAKLSEREPGEGRGR